MLYSIGIGTPFWPSLNDMYDKWYASEWLILTRCDLFSRPKANETHLPD